MGSRSVDRTLLSRSLLALVTLTVLLQPTVASAHNVYDGAYRKFPWKAGTDRTLTTLPGQCPHCPGSESSSAWKAIDIGNMDYETVYSIGPGTVSAYSSGGSGAGMYLRIKDSDGTYVTYEHLSRAFVTSGSVVAGEPIAISGCTGNCSGAHLHLQRQSGTSFSSTGLTLELISGHGDLSRTAYTSDNAGIGLSSGGTESTTMQTAYKAAGGYSSFGVTADIGLGWSPCRATRTDSTWWRYGCAPNGWAGSVQTYLGPNSKKRAIMHATGASASYVLHQGVLESFTDYYAGYDWVHWIGYPTGNRYALSGGTAYRQYFQGGRIDYWPSSCRAAMYIGDSYKQENYHCD